MLTKDLLLCKLKGSRIVPSFVSTEHPELLDLATRLLECHQPERQLRRGEIDELTEPMLAGYPSAKVAHGILKVIENLAEFTTPMELDYPALRMELLTKAAETIVNHAGQTEEQYQASLREAVGDHPLLASEQLYGDLPENDLLTKMHFVTPKQILERYNCGLVQGLLLNANDIQLTVKDQDPARLRRLFKYLKFFRLLASISLLGTAQGQQQDGAGGISIHIDGAASILDQAKRYGLQLACFFPAICSLTHWKLRAEITWKDSKRFLVLDETSGLVSHYHNFSAYVPEEVQLFHRYFKETVQDWQVVGNTPFITLAGGNVAFPDFSFEHASGTVIHLELFHRWHSGQVAERLAWLDKHQDQPLIVGIDRSLLRDENVKQAVESCPWFAARCFLFTDYPTVERTMKCLEATKRDLTT